MLPTVYTVDKCITSVLGLISCTLCMYHTTLIAANVTCSVAVCLSVCLLVTLTYCAKTAKPRCRLGGVGFDSCGPDVLNGGRDIPHGNGQFWGCLAHWKELEVSLYADSIVNNGTTYNNAMRPFVQILWPLVHFSSTNNGRVFHDWLLLRQTQPITPIKPAPCGYSWKRS